MAYYDRYRGSRRRRRNRLKIMLLILLLLVVVGIAALFFLEDAVIFTTDGFRFPFSGEKEPEKDDLPEMPDDIHLEIVDPQPGTTTPDQPDPLPQPQPEPAAPTKTQALFAQGSTVLTDSADLLRQFSQGGFAQLALQVKTPDGISLVDDGITADGVSADSAAFIRELSGMDIPKTAVVSALRDNVRPRSAHRSSALHTSGGATWLDREYMAWFDPAGKDTLSYLTALADACETAGFTQVVLENFHYPTAGKLELIDYGDDHTRRQALTQLASQLRDATGMELGLVLTQTAATDLLDSTSGQDVAELAQYFDVIYVPASSFSADITGVHAALEGTQCRAGLFLTAPADVPAGFDLDYILAAQ